MAEYIDREKLRFLNDFRIDSGKYVGLRLDDVFDELATADVVEREKIDNAIDEINDMPTIGYYEEPLGSRPMVFKDDILTILKRNIGE